MDEQAYWVAWSRLPRMGGRRLQDLYAHFGSLSRAWEAPAWRLGDVPGIGPELAREIAAQRPLRSPADDWAAVTKPPVRAVTWLDETYPAPLRPLADPPPVLYMMGEQPSWERVVAIVGTRDASPYGAGVAHRFGRDLAALGAVVVSGVAAGIDRAAHEGALDIPDGQTVGVLGCGFHYVFPASNRGLYRAIADRGLLMSEYPPDVKPLKGHFPYRNRVISGLSQGVIVVEAKRKSGSLITIDHALEQGKSVFAVPGPIDMAGSEGPHDLLRQGARLVSGVSDVLEELNWALVAAPPPTSDDPTEAAILEALAGGEQQLDGLAARIGLGAAQAGSALLVMQLKGLVRQLPGQRYARAR